MKILDHVFLTFFTSLCAANGIAQEAVTRYEPANFPAIQSTIIDRINFPDHTGDVSVRVFCDVQVSASGDFGHSICRSDHEEKVLFTQAVEKNIDITQITPARVDGKNVSVYFQYTVQFEKWDNIESITLFPHQFAGIEGPGNDYTGPQRYHDRVAARGILTKCTGGFLIWYGIVVPAEGGKPTSVKVLNETDSGNCESHSRQIVEGGMYIPAFLRGVPTAAPYIEIWSDRPWR
ncbi:MAG: hypothetical protein V4628_08890 [Pseudomonadota bacterium]